MIETASNSIAIFYENGERVFPCRCGETHRGDDVYALGYEHECLHDEVLLILPPKDLSLTKLQVVCPGCGKSWQASTKNQAELDAEAEQEVK